MNATWNSIVSAAVPRDCCLAYFTKQCFTSAHNCANTITITCFLVFRSGLFPASFVFKILASQIKCFIFKRLLKASPCVKSVRIQSFSGPYCHAFGLNTERYKVICPYSVWMWENTDQKNSEYGHFSRSVTQHKKWSFRLVRVNKCAVNGGFIHSCCRNT